MRSTDKILKNPNLVGSFEVVSASQIGDIPTKTPNMQFFVGSSAVFKGFLSEKIPTKLLITMFLSVASAD